MPENYVTASSHCLCEQATDLERLNTCFERSKAQNTDKAGALHPVKEDDIMKLCDLLPEAEQRLVRKGLELIAEVCSDG